MGILKIFQLFNYRKSIYFEDKKKCEIFEGSENFSNRAVFLTEGGKAERNTIFLDIKY